MQDTHEQPHSDSWLTLKHDTDTGIESVSAHFKGHAYDPHDHDEVLLGVTQQGLQRFHCHRALHTGKAVWRVTKAWTNYWNRLLPAESSV